MARRKQRSGGALGLDPATCLALAGARRIRDLLIFVPGLFAWQVAESSGKAHMRMVGAPAPVTATRARGNRAERERSPG
jgi:hypothetical protein